MTVAGLEEGGGGGEGMSGVLLLSLYCASLIPPAKGRQRRGPCLSDACRRTPRGIYLSDALDTGNIGGRATAEELACVDTVCLCTALPALKRHLCVFKIIEVKMLAKQKHKNTSVMSPFL